MHLLSRDTWHCQNKSYSVRPVCVSLLPAKKQKFGFMPTVSPVSAAEKCNNGNNTIQSTVEYIGHAFSYKTGQFGLYHWSHYQIIRYESSELVSYKSTFSKYLHLLILDHNQVSQCLLSSPYAEKTGGFKTLHSRKVAASQNFQSKKL